MRTIAVMALVLVTGCVSSSEIVPMGKDSYMVSGQARGGVETGKSAIEATKAANAYCAQKGLLMMPRTTNTEGSATWTAETSTLIFTCLKADDPEYKRPELHKEVGVEDRQAR
jgi:hypothetical protein